MKVNSRRKFEPTKMNKKINLTAKFLDLNYDGDNDNSNKTEVEKSAVK